MIVFDLETGPLPLEYLRPHIPPFDGHVGEFDPASVKCGNVKDPIKIAEKINAAKAAHEAERAALPQRIQEHEAKFIERAALSPLTGQVLAVGFQEAVGAVATFCVGDAGGGDPIDEGRLIEIIWASLAEVGPFVGHNIFGFDLPFLIRRSWLLGIDVPDDLRVNGRYWHPRFIDTMDVWGCGSREYTPLDTLAKACGLPGKPEGVNGGDFARLFNGTPEEKQQAIDYLRNDLLMTWHVAARLQIG